MSLNYAVLDYGTAVRALTQLVREQVPDYTEQDAYDLLQDLISLTGYRSQRDAALIDRVGSGLFWPTFRTRAEAIALAALLGYRLRRESPAIVPVIAKLTAGLSGGPTLLIPDGAPVSTRADDGEAAVVFEQDGDLLAHDTSFDGADNFGGDVFMWDQTDEAWTDFNDGAIDEVWPQGALGDAIYFGHPQLMFTELALAFVTHVTEPGVWEVYDPLYSFAPGPDGSGSSAAVRNNFDGTLTFRVDAYTGSARYDDGVFTMEVLCLATGESETCVVEWTGSRNEITTSSLLGQSSPSTSPGAYEIRPYWVTPENLSDGTDAGAGPMDQDGSVTWDLPQTTARAWAKTEVNGTEAFWIRCRRAGAAGADSPELSTVAGGSVADERWWLYTELLQGETVVENIGTGDGAPLQAYALTATDFIEGSLELTVAGAPWEILDSIYSAGPSDQSATLREDSREQLFVQFGDGLRGAIPLADQAIVATYRIGATRNGNVGIGSVTRPQQVLSLLDGFTNPRVAAGWQPRDGFNKLDLERLRQWVPGWARVGRKVVTPEDAAYHAVSLFVTEDGRHPIARADFFESTTDAQILQGYVVGPDGGTVSAADLAEAERYFNGTSYGLQRDGGVMLSNQRVALSNATLVEVDVTVVLTVLQGAGGGVAGNTKAGLRGYLKPLARGEDGAFVHRSGGKVSPYRIGAVASDYAKAIAGKKFSDINVPVPASTVSLEPGELPTLGSLTVTVNEES